MGQKVRSDFQKVATPEDRIYGQNFDLVFLDLRAESFADQFTKALKEQDYTFEGM